MKVGKLKTTQRREDAALRNLGILSYGEKNDYPNRVLDVFKSSTTGSGCLRVAKQFLYGNGFADERLAELIVNEKNQTADSILKKVVGDFVPINGMAVHVNYNATLQPVEYQHVPFEHCRIEIDEEGEPTGRIGIHSDWTRRLKYKRKRVSRDDIKWVYLFNPDPKAIREQIKDSGGINEYNGQILWYGADGDLEYPLSEYDSAVTDMSTEESVTTVIHRNAKHNYLPAGMIVRYRRPQSTQNESGDAENYEEDTFLDDVSEWQGDERAAKMLVVDCDEGEEPPKFVPFPIQNFDRMFDSTTKYVQDNIGRLFMQPPILRGVDVGAGFGSELMRQAYNYYNSVLEPYRHELERYFAQLFPDYDVTIQPLQYIDDEEPNGQE